MAFDIPNIDESIRRDFCSGEISLEESAIEWYEAGSTNFIDLDYAMRKLGLS